MAALLVSAATYVIFPDAGLHLAFASDCLASLLSLPLMRISADRSGTGRSGADTAFWFEEAFDYPPCNGWGLAHIPRLPMIGAR